MTWKQYSYAALVGAGIAFGIIIASRLGDSGLGAARVIVGCILSAILTVKTTKVADSKG
ncbi:MAG: hypothetical protein ACLPWG_05095 [Steroidobacteraceae bacterium]